jgi:hypothetical protein
MKPFGLFCEKQIDAIIRRNCGFCPRKSLKSTRTLIPTNIALKLTTTHKRSAYRFRSACACRLLWARRARRPATCERGVSPIKCYALVSGVLCLRAGGGMQITRRASLVVRLSLNMARAGCAHLIRVNHYRRSNWLDLSLPFPHTHTHTHFLFPCIKLPQMHANHLFRITFQHVLNANCINMTDNCVREMWYA